MKRILFATASIFAMASFTIADTNTPTRPAGWEGISGPLSNSKCDPDRFTAILNEAGDTVLYWNNPTCKGFGGGGGGRKFIKIDEPEEPNEPEEPEEPEEPNPCACLTPEDETSFG